MGFLEDAELTIRLLDNYYRESVEGRRPVIRQARLEELVHELELDDLARRGGLGGERLKTFLERYLAHTTRLHHPGYLAHQVAVPHPSGALGSLVDGFTNNAMAIYEMGPAAAAIEHFVLGRLTALVGWPAAEAAGSKPGPAPGGVLTHGGSLANLTALAAARHRAAPRAWTEGVQPGLAVLASPVAHYSIKRSLAILGLGERSFQPLELDGEGRIRPDRLAEGLRQARERGLRPVALVANAASTAVGLYDPLVEIGAFCREQGLWFHVDATHGGSALFSPRLRPLLRGIETADSLVWDAHKLLRTPTLCAAVLVRDAASLDSAFQQEASYLFHEKEEPGFDFIHRTVECTKAGLGLRLFLVMAALGEEGLAHYIERQCALAEEAHAFLSAQPDFECAVRPESNIVCFRRRGDDELQMRIRNRLLAEGEFYLSTAEFRGRRYLRLVFMSPATEMRQVRELVERIRQWTP